MQIEGSKGIAGWYSKSDGSFVSTYYYKKYPGWVKKWNAKKLADKYKDTSCELLHDVSTYVFGKDDDRPPLRNEAISDRGRIGVR